MVFHPIFELPDGNRNDWTVSLDAKTHWIEIPQRLPTGETQPIENFFGSDRTAIELKKYALIDDVFTDLIRDANGRATMKLMYNGKELHVSLGPNYKTVLAWSTPLARRLAAVAWRWSGRAAALRSGGASGSTRAVGAVSCRSRARREGRSSGRSASRRRARADRKGFIAFEPMVAITNALNLAHKGVYKELQRSPPGGSWKRASGLRRRATMKVISHAGAGSVDPGANRSECQQDRLKARAAWLRAAS